MGIRILSPLLSANLSTFLLFSVNFLFHLVFFPCWFPRFVFTVCSVFIASAEYRIYICVSVRQGDQRCHQSITITVILVTHTPFRIAQKVLSQWCLYGLYLCKARTVDFEWKALDECVCVCARWLVSVSKVLYLKMCLCHLREKTWYFPFIRCFIVLFAHNSISHERIRMCWHTSAKIGAVHIHKICNSRKFYEIHSYICAEMISKDDLRRKDNGKNVEEELA